nr:copia protein [Tanacetum cinerariifolium]
MLPLAYSDVVARNRDAISSHCMVFLHQLYYGDGGIQVFVLLVYVILPSGYTSSTVVYTYYSLQGWLVLPEGEFKNHSSNNEESLGEDASKQGRIGDADAEVTFIDETSNDARNKNNKISNNKRNKARLVAQGHTQEEGINHDEVFALVARIKAIWLFLAYSSFMGFMSMNYQTVVVGNQPNHNVGIKENLNASKVGKETNENEVHVSPSGCDKTKKHDEKGKRQAKGKSLVGLPTRVRDLRDEFKEFSVDSTNRVNAASAPVTVARLNPTNSTNSFNTASPSDTVVSPNFRIARKYSFVDPFNYPDDPDMPTLDDIVYSDYEEDVGTEADLSNLEANISVSLIPTTIIHKDHPVTQI